MMAGMGAALAIGKDAWSERMERGSEGDAGHLKLRHQDE